MTLLQGPPPRLAGVLFDFDGVLINSLEVMRRAFETALAEVHPDHIPDAITLFREYRRYLGWGFPQIMDQMGLSRKMHAPFRRTGRALAGQVPAYPGALELLDWCGARGLVLGIATGKDHERTCELLDLLGIRDRFAGVYASDTVDRPKPAPEMAERFMQAHGFAPDQVLVIGDAEADIACGKAAGCRTAAAGWGYTPVEELRDLSPDYVFHTPQDAQSQIAALLAAEEAGR